MEIINLSPGELIPYSRNAKKHPEEQIEHIANSIREFGFRQPIVIDRDNVVVIGHGRLMAAKKLGLTTVPCVRADDLTEAQVNALRLIDNKTNESEWDDSLLIEELATLSLDFDMGDFGFEDLSLDTQEPGTVVDDEFDPDEPVEARAKRGDIYQLGRHRLMCGDSTDFDDVDRLLDGREIDLAVTDPPYNMAYEGAGNTRDRKSKKILNDHMPSAEFRKFLVSVFSNYYSTMRDGASIYVFYKELGEGVFITSLTAGGLTYKQMLIWVKNQIVLGGSKYQSMYEPFLMGCKGDTIKTWNGKRRQRNVIESIDLMGEVELRDLVKQILDEEQTDILRCRKQLVNDLHPTMKPVRLIARLIENSSNPGDCVCDLFAGSGTTLIAAEQLNRTCYMMELDPRFVDVIIARWEEFTGQKAVLLNGDEQADDS